MKNFDWDAYIKEAEEKAKKRNEVVNRIKKSIVFPEGITKKQELVLNQIIRDIPEFDFYGTCEEYEVKQFDIRIGYGKTLFVVFTTGRIGDEGTFASILCRKHRTFWLGERGGIRVMNSKHNIFPCSRFDLMNRKYEH